MLLRHKQPSRSDCQSQRLTSVVLPDPRKPVISVTGTGLTGVGPTSLPVMPPPPAPSATAAASAACCWAAAVSALLLMSTLGTAGAAAPRGTASGGSSSSELDILRQCSTSFLSDRSNSSIAACMQKCSRLETHASLAALWGSGR